MHIFVLMLTQVCLYFGERKKKRHMNQQPKTIAELMLLQLERYLIILSLIA